MVWGGGESFKLLLVQFVCLGKTHKTHACSKIFNPIVDVGGGKEGGKEGERESDPRLIWNMQRQNLNTLVTKMSFLKILF